MSTKPLVAITFVTSLVAVAALAHAQGTPSGRSPAPPATRGVAPAAPQVTRLTDAEVKQLVAYGEEDGGLSHDNAGIFKIANGSSVIGVMSARNMIVTSAAKAAVGGGRYVPPADMKADIVMVGCGDSELGDRWDCVRMQVSDSNGRRVAPITIKSGPNVYRNGFGATWTVREIHAVFLASQLRNGFSVVVADAGGTEYQEDVSKARAETELLFTIPQTSAQVTAAEAKAKAAAIAAEPTPPDTFDVSVDAQPGGWIITSHNVGYTWRECEATIGANRARIAPLNGSSVVVTAADFLPAIVSTATKPRIRCVAKGQRLEGPFPSELAIRVQSVAKRIWRVTNLTDAPWTDCSAAFGNNTAKVVYLPANDSRTLVETDFTPRIEGTDPEPSAMTFTCIANGKTVTARPATTPQPTITARPATTPQPTTAAGQQALPVRIEREGEGWRVSSLGTDQTFNQCEAQIEQSRSTFGSIAPGGAVVINPGNFYPRMTEFPAGARLTVSCRAGNVIYTATATR